MSKNAHLPRWIVTRVDFSNGEKQHEAHPFSEEEIENLYGKDGVNWGSSKDAAS